jgi:hypothetical protein
MVIRGKRCVFLREWFDGKFRLEPLPDGAPRNGGPARTGRALSADP